MSQKGKKRKYFIDERESFRLLKSIGLRYRKMNWYQLRIYHEEFTGFFDWFHTQGTVCVNKEGEYAGKLDECGHVEKLSEVIKDYVYGK